MGGLATPGSATESYAHWVVVSDLSSVLLLVGALSGAGELGYASVAAYLLGGPTVHAGADRLAAVFTDRARDLMLTSEPATLRTHEAPRSTPLQRSLHRRHRRPQLPHHQARLHPHHLPPEHAQPRIPPPIPAPPPDVIPAVHLHDQPRRRCPHPSRFRSTTSPNAVLALRAARGGREVD
jgi:hypothetical protein